MQISLLTEVVFYDHFVELYEHGKVQMKYFCFGYISWKMQIKDCNVDKPIDVILFQS